MTLGSLQTLTHGLSQSMSPYVIAPMSMVYVNRLGPRSSMAWLLIPYRH